VQGARQLRVILFPRLNKTKIKGNPIPVNDATYNWAVFGNVLGQAIFLKDTNCLMAMVLINRIHGIVELFLKFLNVLSGNFFLE
jgi:hypothetical protein